MPGPNLLPDPPPISINGPLAIFQTLSKAKGLSQSGQKDSLSVCEGWSYYYFDVFQGSVLFFKKMCILLWAGVLTAKRKKGGPEHLGMIRGSIKLLKSQLNHFFHTDK